MLAMDQQGDCIIATSTAAQHYCQLIKKPLGFLVLFSIFSFLISNYAGSKFSFALQFSPLIFPPFAQALDRRYMFLICNGILAFLAKNLKLTSSGLNRGGFTEDGVKQGLQLPQLFQEAAVQENELFVEYVDSPVKAAAPEEEQTGVPQEQGFVLESEDQEEDDDEVADCRGLESTPPNDANFSTEELNQKFEEFIKKMKEEFRIEAQQQRIAV